MQCNLICSKMEVLCGYLLSALLIVYIHAGESVSTKLDGCNEQNNCKNKIVIRTKRESGFNRRVCSPNRKWNENDEFCICSSDGFRIYCRTTNVLKLRRKRSADNKNSKNCCNGETDHEPSSHQGNCCRQNMCHFDRNINFCNCMQNFFYSSMYRNFQNFCCCLNCCCTGNRRKNVRANSCCDNCCEGLCDSTPDWKCYCTHDKNCARLKNQPLQSDGNQPLADEKSVDLNTFFEFCKSQAISETVNKGKPAKIALNTIFEFCNQQMHKQPTKSNKPYSTNSNVNTVKNEKSTNPEEGLKSIFKYMEAYIENEKELRKNPKPTPQGPSIQNKQLSQKEQDEGLNQIFSYMKACIEKEKGKNENKPVLTQLPPTTPKNKKNIKSKNTTNQPQMSHRERSNYNNPNNKAYRGDKIRNRMLKGKSTIEDFITDSSDVGSIITVESNEMVYINV